MKVLFINSVYGEGSTGRIVKEIGSVLTREGYEYQALYGRGKRNLNGEAICISSSFSTYLDALLTRLTGKAGFFSYQSTRNAISYIKRYNPDVIHLHNLHGYYINIQILFEYLKTEYKGVVIWTMHDCWAFTGHCAHYTYARCKKWESSCFKCPEKKRYPKSLFFDTSKSNYSKKKEIFTNVPNMIIVTPSQWLQGQIARSFLKEYPCVTINNGIDLQLFSPQEVQREEEKKIILNVVDGLDERKGFKDLIRLSNMLSDKYQLKMVGLKEKEIKEIPANIIAEKKTKDIDVLIEYYREADFFVNTTYEDTFPTVNIEALACGVPVITYDSGGSPEIVDSTCGSVVPVGEIENIATIIESNKFEREACRERSKKFDKWDKYGQYIELYRNAIVEKH